MMDPLNIPSEVAERFSKAAVEAGLEPDRCAVEALERYLEDMEDVRTIEERLKNPGRRYTMEEVLREIDVDD